MTSDIGKLLEDRLKMYETAETNARTSGETSRARRYSRAIKTLKDLIKQAKAGKAIAEADIPPEVSLNAHKPTESNISPETSDAAIPEAPSVNSFVSPKHDTSEEEKSQVPKEDVPQENQQNEKLLEVLRTRKEQYKVAALKHKKLGDKITAISYIKISKQFESVIQAVENGQPVDLSRMPGKKNNSNIKFIFYCKVMQIIMKLNRDIVSMSSRITCFVMNLLYFFKICYHNVTTLWLYIL